MASSWPTHLLYIGGKWLRPAKEQYIDVISPITEKTVGVVPAGGVEDIHLAVTAAVEAEQSGTWSKSRGSFRAPYLRSIASKIRDKKQHLAVLESTDCGKPLDEALWDMDDVATCFDFYAGLAEKLDTEQGVEVDVGSADFKVQVFKEALGVVAAITPWNYPLLMATWKVAPALAAGNCVVLKPSELASTTCLELALIAHEIGLPPGVLNVVTGYGAEAGAALSEDTRVAKVAFTGSAATGRKVATAAGSRLRPTTLELGGKSSVIVFEDADLERAVEWVMFGAFWTNGQICSATSRLLVHERIAAPFLALLQQRAESICVADPLTPGCRLGPLVSAGQHARVVQYIESGLAEGAVLLTGGTKRPPHLDAGYYVLPTIFTDVTPSMKIWQEEIFGPVLCAMTFSTEAEAISAANTTEYGLAGAVISADAERCKRVAAALRVGVVWVNCSQPCFCQAPWGGVKNSGYGRELGTWGLESFLSVKQVTTYVSPEVWGWYKTSGQQS